MKIRMTASVRESLDGTTVEDLLEGEEYDTVDSPFGVRLALAHIAKGVAVRVEGAPLIAQKDARRSA